MINEAQGRYIGQPKERYEWVLKFVSSHTTSRGYYVHNYIDREGNSVIAFDDEPAPVVRESEGSSFEIQQDAIFRCKATVNRHSINTFQGNNVKQTIINRVADVKLLFHANGEDKQ